MPLNSGRCRASTGGMKVARGSRRVNRNPLLFRLGLIAWIVWVGVTADRLVDAQQPPRGDSSRGDNARPDTACPGNAHQPASGLRRHRRLRALSRAGGKEHHALAPRPGQGSAFTRRHARMRKLPRSRAGTRGRRREGAHQEVQSPDAQRGQRDLSVLPQPRHARGLGRAALMRRGT